MKTQYKPVVILTAELAEKPEALNNDRTTLLKDMLTETNLNFYETVSKFFDKKNNSFCVIINNDSELETVKDFAFKNFDQESVLYLHGDRAAELHSNDGLVDNVGQFKGVDKATALVNKDGYVYSPKLNQYYILEEGR